MEHRYLLLMRFALMNIVAFALVFAAWLQGWLEGLFEPTVRLLSGIIVAVFLYGLGMCALRIRETSLALNDIGAGGKKASERVKSYLAGTPPRSAEKRTIGLDVLRMKLAHRIQIVRHIANLLVFLGLIGTVIGFIIALSGVDAEAVSQADSVASMVATLIQGMSVALYTTLLGAVLNVWLNINYRMLAGGTVNLVSAIMSHGDKR